MIACIVPAAGLSTRFSWNKLLYLFDGEPVIIRTVKNVSSSRYVSRIIIVTGYESDKVSETIKEYIGDLEKRIRIIYNPEYTRGMSSSIKKGVESLQGELHLFKGIMVNPGDVAWVHPGIYDYVSMRFLESGKKIAVASYRGRKGHPIVFSSDLFIDLTGISEESRGLKAVVEKYISETLVVETGYPGVLLDLDTVLDLNRVKEYSWR
ncbi:nucleotidyltransferase family protein [Desulfurococcus amylolyticus]|uniref:Molybdenum cofactor cytidylyltransferase n=1 Tax=Desulfurococcus amylolyticus DSM 16532 TaxID=768672 RepID=I3XS27_DESAM|nr:nucleotidyltransferase family protein [Desulfurococcus amylolyticus]AFL66751.1 molybdenum cofactor cytidylyltransferase [Desulfurococcus amylolyticus DSM 16532]